MINNIIVENVYGETPNYVDNKKVILNDYDQSQIELDKKRGNLRPYEQWNAGR